MTKNLTLNLTILAFSGIAFSGCAEEASSYQQGPNLNTHAEPDAQGRPKRGARAQAAKVVQQDKELSTTGSCAGACGDISPERLCWCDDDCVSNEDCCSDYEKECVDDPAEDEGESGENGKKQIAAITGYRVSGKACELAHEIRVHSNDINSINNIISSTFYEFLVEHPDGNLSEHCRLTVYAKWTPGTRIVLADTNLVGNADLSELSRARATIRTSIRAGYTSSTHKSISLVAPFEKEYRRDWTASALKVYSNCSGSGSFSFDMNIRLHGTSHDRTEVGLSGLRAEFRQATPGEAPGC